MAPRTKPRLPSESETAESATVSEPRTDWGYRIILAGVGVVVVWLLAMPWVPAVTEATMRRFHLQSGSFPRWVAQFPIPGMYNFANQYRILVLEPVREVGSRDGESPSGQRDGESPSGQRDGESLSDEFAEPPVWRHANHFPARVFTFGDGRYKRLRNGRSIWVDLESRYRGQSLASEFELRPIGNTTGYRVIRRPSRWSAGNDDGRESGRSRS